MRSLLFAPLLVTPFLLAATLPAAAQDSVSPHSQNAGNLTGGSGSVASKLPSPGVTDDSPVNYLKAARTALASGKTGLAQESLERAESRLLDRDVAPSRADVPSSNPSVVAISEILQSLGAGKKSQAMQELNALIGTM